MRFYKETEFSEALTGEVLDVLQWILGLKKFQKFTKLHNGVDLQ